MPRVISILRVSTKEQDIARQRWKTERYAREHNLEILRTLDLVGQSGTSVLKNEQVLAVLEAMKRPEVDGILVDSLDRLFRPKEFTDFSIFQPFKTTGKLIWSATEGRIDPSTDQGFRTCCEAGVAASMEFRNTRRRSMDGKEILRMAGCNVNGRATIPRGVAYDKNATPKYRFQEPDCSRVARMFQLFLEGWSLHAIAAEVGGWSYQGIRTTLKNRIWAFGEIIYPANKNRPEPLIVKVIEKPLISPAIWQEVNDRLKTSSNHWRHTRRSSESLLRGMVRCQCGEPCYPKKRSRNSGHDTYLCATRHPSGTGCGTRRVRKELVDQMVIRIVREQLSSPLVLPLLVDAIERRQLKAPARNQHTAQERSRLEAKRRRVLDNFEDGYISREERNEKVLAVDRELATLRIEAPAEPHVDTVKLAAALQAYFKGFEKWPLERQQKLLRWAIGDIVLNPKGIDYMTLKGSFLAAAASWETNLRDAVDKANGAKVSLRSTPRCLRRWRAQDRRLREG